MIEEIDCGHCGSKFDLRPDWYGDKDNICGECFKKQKHPLKKEDKKISKKDQGH